MNYKRFYLVLLFLGIVLGSSLFVVANQKDLKEQVVVTLDNAEKEIGNIINTKESELKYESVLSDGVREAYKNKKGDLYFYKDTGEMVKYISNKDLENYKISKANEEDIKKAADTYLENLVEASSYYQMDCLEYDGYTNLYLVRYVHKVNGLNTNDLVLIDIDNSLNLISFSIPRTHAFQKMEGIEIDVEKIKQEALSDYYQKYGASAVDVKIEDLRLGTDDNENIGYQIAVNGNILIEGEKVPVPELIFIPYQD